MRTRLIIPIAIVLIGVAAAAYLSMTQSEPAAQAPATSAHATPTLTEQRAVSTPTPRERPTTVAPTSTGERMVTGRFSAEEEPIGVDTQVFAVAFTDTAVEPQQLRVKVGDIVIFRNATTVPVKPSSDTYPFTPSGPLAPGEEYQVTFSKAGTWTFVDALHTTRSGTIVVTK